MRLMSLTKEVGGVQAGISTHAKLGDVVAPTGVRQQGDSEVRLLWAEG